MSILFATPCYGNMVTMQFHNSCMKLGRVLDEVGLPHDFLSGGNDSLIPRIRCEMTRTYLTSEYKRMFWLDSDIEFTPGDVAKVYNMDADIGVGVYAMKKPDKQQFAAWKDGALVENLDQFDAPIEVDYAGTGFMCIKREVIDKLTSIHGTYNGNWGPTPALYNTPITDGEFAGVQGRFMESEDYYFCRIAKEAGFKIIMDPTVRLGHYGQYRFGA